MNFKTFINEDIGLGDIGKNIERIFNQKAFKDHARTFLNTDNSAEIMPDTPPSSETNLAIPTLERTGRIAVLLTKRNPIYVRLTDGTEAHFTYDEFKRIEGEPAIGKTMTIVFQRHANDNSPDDSQIQKVIIKD